MKRAWIALLLVCGVRSARAEDALAVDPPAAHTRAPEHAEWGNDRVLDGHVFPFPQFVASSFVVSSFGVRAGVEARQVPHFAATPLSGDAASQSIDLSSAVASEASDASVRVHRLLAIWLSGYGRARVGTNTKTILGSGADFELGGDLGVLVRLFSSKRLQLSARGSFGYYGGTQAGIDRFYQSVRALADKTVQSSLTGSTTVDQQTALFAGELLRASNEIITSLSGYRTAVMLTGAQALGPYVGLQEVIGVSYDRGSEVTSDYLVSQDRSVRLSAVDKLVETSLGFAVDVGSGDDRGIPIDLVFEYLMLPTRVERDASADSSLQKVIAHRLAFDLFYAGRSDLQLGLSVYTVLAQAREVGVNGTLSGRPRQTGGAFTFRYIW